MAIENIQEPTFNEPGKDKIAKRKYEPIPVPLTMRPAILNMLARWGATEVTFARIADTLLEDFNMVASAGDVERIYESNRNKVVAIRKEQREGLAQQGEKLLNKAHMMLSRELDRAMRDMELRDALDLAVDSGAVDPREYRKAIAKLRILSIGDIIKLANHVAPKNAAPQLPPPQTSPLIGEPNSPESSALSKELGDAVARGDAVEIQRILWSKKTESAVDPSAVPIATDDPEPSASSREP